MSDAAATLELAVVRVGEDEYVIDLKRVDEVMPTPPITPVPRAPWFLEGVVRYRQEVLPVVDLRKRLGVQPRPDALGKRRDRLVVCRVGGRRLGLVVDGVGAVVRASRAEVTPAPLTRDPAGGPAVVLGVVTRGRALRLMLDVRALCEGHSIDAPLALPEAR